VGDSDDYEFSDDYDDSVHDIADAVTANKIQEHFESTKDGEYDIDACEVTEDAGEDEDEEEEGGAAKRSTKLCDFTSSI
jgi:hypothetical protein